MADDKFFGGVPSTCGRLCARLAAACAVALLALFSAASAAQAQKPEPLIEHPAPLERTKVQSTAFAGTTDDFFDAVTVLVYAGPSAEGTAVEELPELLPTLEGTWSGELESPLQDGRYTAVAEQTNFESETGKSPSVTFTVDTTAPVVSLLAPSKPTKDDTPTLTGASGTQPGDRTTVTVAIHRGTTLAGELVEEASASSAGGEWSLTAGALADGAYTAQAVQSDEAGNVGQSEAQTFVIDTKAPSPAITVAPEWTNDTSPTLEGTLGTAAGDEAAVKVVVHKGTAGGAVAEEAQANVSGSKWSLTTSALAEGTYVAVASQSDNAGNVGSSEPATFTVDVHAPAVTFNQPASPSDNSTPTLGGAAGSAAGDIPTVTVRVYQGSFATGTPWTTHEVSASSGSWSYPTGTLPDGTYTAQAVQADAAGNTGASLARTFVIDTKSPSPAITVAPEWTNDTTPTLEGTLGTVTGDEAAVKVVVHKGTAGGAVAEEAQANVSGSKWSLTTSSLAEGTYVAVAFQRDSAGNIGNSEPATITIDLHAPSVTLNQPPTPGNASTPTLGGAGGTAPGDIATVTVRVYKGGSTGGTPTITHEAAVSSGSWSYTTPALEDGTYTAQVTQRDKAGNTGTSLARTFLVDTLKPALTLTSPSTKVLHLSQPTFAGAAGTASGDSATVTLKIYEGTSASGAPVDTLERAVSAGKWTTGSSGPRLADETYTAQAEQSDAAGNVARATFTFTIETNSPVVTLTTAGLVSREGNEISTPTPRFSGTAGTEPEDSAAVVVNIYAGASASGAPVEKVIGQRTESSWSAGPSAPLQDGEYTAQAEQTDESVGAQTGVSQPSTFLVDGTPPHVTLTSPADGATTTSSSMPVRGTAGTDPGDSQKVSVLLFAGASDASSPIESVIVDATGGGFSTTLGGLSPGTYTVRADQQDDVGNTGHSHTATFTVTTPPAPPPATPSPPAASFTWFPSQPKVGEPVSLVSTSTDAGSPLVAFAWSLAASGAFSPGASVLTTTFSTPGEHIARLSVAAADGLSASVAEKIAVAPQPLVMMQPFPVVRIAGSESRRGVRITLFTVLVPPGASITVSCHGRGCARKHLHLVAAAAKGSSQRSVMLRLRRFERSLRPGTVLEVRVVKAGEIGKYTRFLIRRGKLPLRTDRCVSSSAAKPFECPT